jgi:hypothetical protein
MTIDEAITKAQIIVHTWEPATPYINDGTDWISISNDWILHFYLDLEDGKMRISATIYPVVNGITQDNQPIPVFKKH